MVATQTPAYLQSIRIRPHPVQQDQVRDELHCSFQRVRAVADKGQIEALVAQGCRQRFPSARPIAYDENRTYGHLSFCLSQSGHWISTTMFIVTLHADLGNLSSVQGLRNKSVAETA